MSKNIFLSGIYHETHTFLGEPTTLKDFIIYNDQEIINENTGNGSPTDGFIEYASQQKWNIIPGIQMSARPSGTCLLYTSPSPRDLRASRMPSSA